MAEPCPQPQMEPQESIYHWLPAGQPESAKPVLRYISSFRPSVRREMDEARKAPCQTMGIPKLQLPTPKEYLRKHAKEGKAPPGMHERVKRQPIKPQLPLQSDRPLMGIHSEKNFVTANVAEAIMAVAKKPLHACVDQRKGEKFLLDDSGLVQRFLKKKDFGVTPKYIQRRKKEAVDVRKERAAARRECLQKKRLTRLSSRERESILESISEAVKHLVTVPFLSSEQSSKAHGDGSEEQLGGDQQGFPEPLRGDHHHPAAAAEREAGDGDETAGT